MESLARLPVFFALQGRRALVAGNGVGAAWKAELLAAAGANVEICAPEPGDEMLAAVTGTMTLHRRRWSAGDFAGAASAVGGC
jgi:uroporphyrin-III C-methyltransferase/precorrin-2 dehydrogenase/sirohydrochlorin ferrochelatase